MVEAVLAATVLFAGSVQGFSDTLGTTDGDEAIDAGDALVKENASQWDFDWNE